LHARVVTWRLEILYNARIMARQPEDKLARPVGLFSLIAVAINGIVGAAIFVLPATVAKLLGPASPLAYLIAWFAVTLIGLCFAEMGSIYENSGGPYVYAQAAFGSFVAFEVGWLFLLARLTAVAAISNGFTTYLGQFWPQLAAGPGRVLAITLMIVILAAVNFAGVRYGAWAINLLTIGKLVPLLIFIAVGLFWLDRGSYSFRLPASGTALRSASLVLIFALGGFEYASVPSEEVTHPRRDTGISMLAAITICACLYMLIQIIALSTLPGLADSPRPLASAAAGFLGPPGATLLALGAILSTAGTNGAIMLVGPRILYALARDNQLPKVLARVHPRYRTPHIAIICFAVLAWAAATYSNFAQLAALSAIARLPYYMTTSLAVPVVRHKQPQLAAQRKFRIPGGALIPVLAALVCIWLLTGSSRSQAVLGLAALASGALIYLIGNRLIDRRNRVESPIF